MDTLEKVEGFNFEELEKKMEEHPNLAFHFFREDKYYQKLFNMKQVAREMNNLSYNTLHHGLSRETQYNVKNQDVLNKIMIELIKSFVNHVMEFENPQIKKDE
jgi:predicted RNase H-like nuclease